jgi:hypothetical protein
MFFYKYILEFNNKQIKSMKNEYKIQKKILLSLIGISCTTVFASQFEGAAERQKVLEEKLNKMTEDQKLKYLRNKANGKAATWQGKINQKNSSFQEEELRKLSKLMKKNLEKILRLLRRGLLRTMSLLLMKRMKNH